MAKDMFETKLDAIKAALEAMITELNTELIKLAEGKGGNPKAVLDKLDAAIINDVSVKRFLLGDDEVKRAAVQQLITDVKNDIQASIESAKVDFGLDETQHESVVQAYKANETVKRTDALEEFRSDTTSGDEPKKASERLAAVKAELEGTEDEVGIEEKLEKLGIVKSLVMGGEPIAATVARLKTEREAAKLTADNPNKIKGIKENTYDFESKLEAITKGKTELINTSNVAEVKEVINFFKQLESLKKGNPEIEKILNDFAGMGISVSDKNIVSGLTTSSNKRALKQLIQRVRTEATKDGTIDFSGLKNNSIGEYGKDVTAEMQAILSSGWMKLYPKEAKKWDEALKTGDSKTILQTWKEMHTFLDTRDFEYDFSVVNDAIANESALISRKTELEGKRDAFTKMADGEEYENVPNELKTIRVGDLEVTAKKDLLGLNAQEIENAQNDLYKRNKSKFSIEYDKAVAGDPSMARKGFFGTIGLMIKHRTLSPRGAKVAEWSKEQIATTIRTEEVEIARKQGERDRAIRTGALTPDQLREFREREAALLEQKRKAQEAEIFDGRTASAKDAHAAAQKEAEDEALR